MLDLRAEASLTADQLRTLGAVTRTASALSAVGVLTIIVTFCWLRDFRNPMHRLIFINAFYNALDVTCTMMSISAPQAGVSSALCQFQAFLNQMFPLADVLWTLTMAVNVFLIVFRRYETEALKKLEWKYIAVITTVTFIPAFTFLFIRTDDRGLMYGSVTLWCAIAPSWVLFRIVCYYVPIWTVIFITIIIYVLVGIEILNRRRALKAITSDFVALDDVVMAADSLEGPIIEVDMNRFPPHSRSGAVSASISLASEAPLAPTHQLHVARSSSLSFRQYILMPLFFFIALLSIWVAPTTNRVASFVDPSFSSYSLLLAVGFTGSLRGFWNGLIFITIGMKSWKRRRREEEERPMTVDKR